MKLLSDRSITILRALCLPLCLLLAGNVCSQTYPSRAVRLIIPFPPGGPADIIGRQVALKLSEGLHQQFVVDNRGGGNGNIGAETAAKSTPDGYTLMLLPSALAANQSLYAKLPYNLTRDFTGISSLAVFPLLLVTHPTVEAKSVRELIAVAKAAPGKLNFASAGSGGGAHLAAETFKVAAGINMVHIPYKGTGPAVLGTVAGEVSLMFASIPSVLQHVRAGKLNALGVTSRQRSPSLPEVPTIAEAGLKGYDIASWFGLVAPAGTPDDIVRRIGVEANKVLSTPEFAERLRFEGGLPLVMSPEQFTEFIATESVRWAKIVTDAGAKLD